MPGPWRRLWELFVLADKFIVGDFENHRMSGLGGTQEIIRLGDFRLTFSIFKGNFIGTWEIQKRKTEAFWIKWGRGRRGGLDSSECSVESPIAQHPLGN